jgi:outer membrane protein OmpA-like peptidoglycan-associated protein
VLLVFLGLAFAFYAWNENVADEPGSFRPGPHFAQQSTPFESTGDLLDAIEDGEYAERAGIEQEIATARPIPDKIQIPFVSGTAVPEKEHVTLERFAERVAPRDDIALRVVGCADPPGAAALNERISQQRAESVAAALVELGFDEDRLAEVVGRGESCEVPERVVNVVPIRSVTDVAQAN